MSKKVELLVSLRGDKELWIAGEVFDYDTMPGEIAAEIAMNRGTVRVYEEVTQVPVVPLLPPEDEVSFSDAAKALLEEEKKAEEKEELEELKSLPRFVAKHKGSGRWVVLDMETGKQINEELLSKEDAAALAEKQEAGRFEQTEALSTDEEENPSLVVRTGDG